MIAGGRITAQRPRRRYRSTGHKPRKYLSQYVDFYWDLHSVTTESLPGGLGAGPTSRLPSRITIGDGADTSQSPVPMATMAARDGLQSSEDEAPG